MVATTDTLEQVRALSEQKYKYGFVTDIEADTAPKGLSEDIVRFISARKDEPAWMLEWRLKAYRHWLRMPEPTWSKVAFEPIDYQDAYYYSAPKQTDGPKSLDEVDPKLLETYEKLGIPLQEQAALAGIEVCVDRAPLIRRQRAVERRGRHATRHQTVHLVLHQRDERRDDQPETAVRPHQRRHLEAQRLAASGGQHDDAVTPVEVRLDRGALQRTELAVAPVAGQRVM